MTEKMAAEEKQFPADPPPPYFATEQSYPAPQHYPPAQQVPAYPSYQEGQGYPAHSAYPLYQEGQGYPTHSAYPVSFQYTQVAAPVRENTPPPKTKTSLIVSILALIFCVGAWPCGVSAIICNRRAKTQVALGLHTMARSSLRTATILIICTVVFGTIAWVIFGVQLWNILRIVNAFEHDHDDDDDDDDDR